jgi:quercetin dioxygenase-like cupin family protein
MMTAERVVGLQWLAYNWPRGGIERTRSPKDTPNMTTRPKKAALKDASHLYDVERRAHHLQRPGFRISELQLSPTQTVPWHSHNHISDTFYVLQGRLRLFLQNPKQEVQLGVGESYAVAAGRPHLVTNAGDTSMTILVLQGVGEYDYVPRV